MLEGEWIEHHGKGYPDLPMDTLVQVRFADGDEWEDATRVGDWDICWRHDEEGDLVPEDITHYRVVAP